jgi:hypothetical protein
MAAIVALGLVARVVVVLASPHFVPQSDALDYDRMAATLANHGTFPDSAFTAGPTAFRPPLFPLALGAVYKLVPTGSLGGRAAAGRSVRSGDGGAYRPDRTAPLGSPDGFGGRGYRGGVSAPGNDRLIAYE